MLHYYISILHQEKMRRCRVCLLFLIFLVLPSFVCFSNGEQDVEEVLEYRDAKHYYNLGLKYIKEGNLSRAEFYLRRAQKLDPYNAKICTALGNTHFKNKKYKEAIKFWENALRINPQETEAKKNLQTLRQKTEKTPPEEVIRPLPRKVKKEEEVFTMSEVPLTFAKEGIREAPREIPPHVKQEQLNFAQRELETALAFAPNNPDVHFNLALILVEKNNLEKAIFHLEKASVLDEGSEEKSLYLGIAYLKVGKEDKAEAEFKKVLKINSKNYLALSYLGLILQKSGKEEEALEHFKKAQTLRTGFFLPHLGIAVIYTREGKFLEAKHQWEEVKRLWITSEVHNSLGYACVKIKSLECAQSEFLSAIDKDRGNILSYYNLGMMYLEKDNVKEAINTWEKFLIINPKNVEIRYNLALLYENIGEIDKAIDEYRKVLSLDPTNIPAQSNFSNVVARKAIPYKVSPKKQKIEIDYKYHLSWDSIPIDFPR